MRKNIIDILMNFKNVNIELYLIEEKLPSDCSYEEYSSEILSLIDEGIISPVKSCGINGKNPSLPLKFKINKSLISKDFKEELLKFELGCKNIIDLTYYYKKPESFWKNDYSYLIRIRDYLNIYGFPTYSATRQERSYHLVGDEKWLFSKLGKDIIKRLGILEKLLIEENSEPAMFALNLNFMNFATYKHLIVENKAVYYRLLENLKNVEFSTLIFGAGWRVISCMKDFDKQFPFDDKKHEFYYFGDLDYEGISIYASLKNIIKVEIGSSFYEAYISKKSSKSRTNQRINKNSMDIFFRNFDEIFIEKAKNQLESDRYWPQETFDEDELLLAWRILDDR